MEIANSAFASGAGIALDSRVRLAASRPLPPAALCLEEIENELSIQWHRQEHKRETKRKFRLFNGERN
jgi:hypothetical protein